MSDRKKNAMDNPGASLRHWLLAMLLSPFMVFDALAEDIEVTFGLTFDRFHNGHGYREEDLARLFGGNLLRVYREVLSANQWE